MTRDLPLAVLCLGLIAGAVALAATGAAAACRQALALGLDVSGSVDKWEYRLQMDGLAAALTDPEVQAAFLVLPDAPVRLMIYEWSGQDHQRVLVGWTDIRDPGQPARIAAVLRNTGSVPVPAPSTAIGAAMMFGIKALRRQADCEHKTLDISGDGPANMGRHPRDIPATETAGIIINGLVIGPQARSNTTKNLQNVKSLLGYYRAFVLRGPGSFAEAALDYADFEEAMRRKLIRELRPAILSRRARPPRPGAMQVSRYSGSDPSSNVRPGARRH